MTMTLTGGDAEQEQEPEMMSPMNMMLSAAVEAGEKEETDTLVGQSSQEEDEEVMTEELGVGVGRQQEERRRKRRQQQGAPAGMEHLTYSRMTHLLAVYQNKVQESRRVISNLRRQKDTQLQAVVSQLLLLEARLRREQKGIVGQLAQRDHLITAQRQEIDRLRRDNRRLISRLKKVSEACEAECHEPRIKVSRVEGNDASTTLTRHAAPSASTSPMGRDKPPSAVIRVATSISELIGGNSTTTTTSGQQARPLSKVSPGVYQVSVRCGGGEGGQRVMPAVNPNVALVRATTDRVFHKPPIAEKPRSVQARVPRGQLPPGRTQHIVRSYNGKCTIVSTISRLLEEESDATTTGSSEPSSPEATLKPPTPRVIRLARHFEESQGPAHPQQLQQQHSALPLMSSDPASSPDSSRRGDDRSSTKSFIMDEYEVTSGYNSDAVSEHEYENIQVTGNFRDTSNSTTNLHHHNHNHLHNNHHSYHNQHSAEKEKVKGKVKNGCGDVAVEKSKEEHEEGEDEDDNYVILRAVMEESESVDAAEDQHIYSNVEFSSAGLLIKEVEEEEEEERLKEEEEAQVADRTLVEEGDGSFSFNGNGNNELRSQSCSPEEARNSTTNTTATSATTNTRNAKNRSPIKAVRRCILETNLDTSPADASLLSMSPEARHNHGQTSDPRGAKNVPRSRHNINNLIMDTDGDHMTQNFEEFTLDSLELEEERESETLEERGRGKENRPLHELRRCGDGAENKDGRRREDLQRVAMENLVVGSVASQNNNSNNNNNNNNSNSSSSSGQYEKFLEATGLSQKSILTPTRMYYNHRSVLKPRDVKHRNKLRAAFTTLSTLEEAPSQGGGGGCRYWTEPYI